MKIFATDIDSVLLDITTPIVNHFATRYPGREVHSHGMHHWSMETSFGIFPEEVEEMWGYAIGAPCSTYPDVEDFIRRLKAADYTVIAVTSRVPKYQAAALRDIAHLALDDVIFCVGGKEAVLATLQPVAFIDDKIANLQDAHRAGVKNLYLMDQPWNFSFDLNVPWKRVEHLEEVPLV